MLCGLLLWFWYNSYRQRVSKTVNGVKHNYYYVNGNLAAEETPSYTLFYCYDSNGNLAAINERRSGYNYDSWYYAVCNSRGDVIALYDQDGWIYCKYTYDSWGKLISITDMHGDDISAIDDVPTRNSIRYRGYVYDSETGFYYLNTRYYDPEVGRFISADAPEAMAEDYEAMGQFNLYAYCFNNPVNMSDDNGDWPSWGTKIVIGTAAIAVGVTVTALTGGAALPALIGALKLATAGAAIGAGVGATKHLIQERTVTGIGESMLNGAATGYMAGGLAAGGMQVGRVALTKAGSGISLGKKKTVEMFYHTPKTKGGTILSVKKKLVKSQRMYRFRLDLDVENGLHFHSGVGKAAKHHYRILPWLFK